MAINYGKGKNDSDYDLRISQWMLMGSLLVTMLTVTYQQHQGRKLEFNK